jgi:hypothetical protein
VVNLSSRLMARQCKPFHLHRRTVYRARPLLVETGCAGSHVTALHGNRADGFADLAAYPFSAADDNDRR